MPVVQRSNNRILPNNSRQVDVAKKTLREVIDVQQQRTMNAFRVQGFDCLLYNKLRNGIKCTCQTSRKSVNSRLGKDGKADIGFIHELVTGSDFGAEAYNPQVPSLQELNSITNFEDISSPNSVGSNPFVGTFNVKTDGGDYIREDIDLGIGDNGPNNTVDLDDLVGDFDSFSFGFADVACAVCFGTGYVGGYAPYNGWRYVVDVNNAKLMDTAEIDLTKRPWSTSGNFTFTLTLPRGVVGLDIVALRLNSDLVAYEGTIDNMPLNIPNLMKCFDGKEHTISISTQSEWTHFEIQGVTTLEPAYFEFPKMQGRYNAALLESFEPFDLYIGPNVPALKELDIITENVYGKVLIVQGVTPWNTKEKNVLGWECSVRVCQPQELYTILPIRSGRKVNRPTNFVIDNVRGHRT